MATAEIHQIEGFDPRKRSFNRNVFVVKKDKGYSARLSYEEIHLETPLFSTPAQALKDLIAVLQGKDFMQLRTKLNFKGNKYLTELEPWVDY